MKLEPVGRIDNPEDLDFEPVIVPVIGYREGGDEVVFDLECGPSLPLGTMLRFMRTANDGANGAPVFDEKVVVEFLDRCVLADCKDAWTDFLDDPEIKVTAETIGEVYKVLMAHYSSRPTSQRPGSSRGPAPTKRTSRGAAPKKASTSRRSR